MTELLTAAQMRAIEQAAIESGDVTGLELMERAGRGVVEAVFEEWPELAVTSHRAVVLCGPGNNGGDGFVVARLLKEWGWEVEVFLYGDAEKLPPDARVNYERWCGMGEVQALSDFLSKDITAVLHVDGLFGIGLNRPLSTNLYLTLSALCRVEVPGVGYRIALDVPSGVCADSGRMLGDFEHLPYDLTVTWHLPKLASVLGNPREYCYKHRVKEIGLPRLQIGRTQSRRLVELAENYPGFSDWLRKESDGHKFDHGHALILTGGPAQTGAARLAARGALRIGAGLVTLAAPSDAVPEIAAQITALMLRPLNGPDDLTDILQDQRITALCLGPGLGLDRARELAAVALGNGGIRPRPTVLDADALTAFEGNPETLFALLHPDCILTPHAGEFARLFPDIAAKLKAPATTGPAYSKVDATRDAAARAGCTVLFKGSDTVIADQTGTASINSAHYDRAAPWLATAGSGDVLAGFITGLLARGFAPLHAAETAAWLHVEAALSFGPGLIAEDLPEELPKVLAAL